MVKKKKKKRPKVSTKKRYSKKKPVKRDAHVKVIERLKFGAVVDFETKLGFRGRMWVVHPTHRHFEKIAGILVDEKFPKQVWKA
jgi:hypothetical protein